VVSLVGFHVDELNAYLPFAGMADHSTHQQLSGWLIIVNAKMNFNFRAHRVLNFTQNAYANGTQVREEARHELAARAKQNAPIGGASSGASAFGRVIVRQSSNRICPSRGKPPARANAGRLSTIC